MLEFVLPITQQIDDLGPLGIGHVELALLHGADLVDSLMLHEMELSYEGADRWIVRCQDTGKADNYEFTCLDPHGALLMNEQGVIGDGVAA